MEPQIQYAKTKDGVSIAYYLFNDRGDTELRGFEDPVRCVRGEVARVAVAVRVSVTVESSGAYNITC